MNSVFAPFCCSFYGSPLWLLILNSTAVHFLRVDWRKSLRMLWRVHPMTHGDIIAALSNQLPIHINLEKDLQLLSRNVYLVLTL